MLTKEAAQILCNKLQAKVFKNNGWNGNMILDVINEFTEKPSPKIKIGYAYLNGKGNYVLIKDTNANGFPVGSDNWCYEWNGILGGGVFRDERTLDASKPYKLVEIEDE